MVNTLNCKQFVELITEYLEGGLPQPEVSRFEAHLATCAGCRNYLDQMRQTLRMLGTLEEEQLPPEAKQTLLHLFHEWKQA